MWKRIRELTYIPALFVAGSIAAGIVGSALAQNFPWAYPFQGANPAATIDFKNPPLSMLPNGLTSAFQGANIQPSTVPLGGVAYSSLGTSTTYGASGTWYVGEIYVPFDMTSINCNFLSGATVGTNSVVCALFNTQGQPLANTALAGTATSGASSIQTIAWTSPVNLQTGRYFIAVQGNGTTDALRTIAASTYVGTLAATQTGTFGTVPTLTVPTTFTALDSPIAYLN